MTLVGTCCQSSNPHQYILYLMRHTHTPTHLWHPDGNKSISVVLACLDCQESLFLPQSPLFPSWVWASESLLLGERLSELEVFTWVDVIDLDRLFVHLPPGYAHKPELYLALTISLTEETINLKLYKNIWTLQLLLPGKTWNLPMKCVNISVFLLFWFKSPNECCLVKYFECK